MCKYGDTLLVPPYFFYITLPIIKNTFNNNRQYNRYIHFPLVR